MPSFKTAGKTVLATTKAAKRRVSGDPYSLTHACEPQGDGRGVPSPAPAASSLGALDAIRRRLSHNPGPLKSRENGGERATPIGHEAAKSMLCGQAAAAATGGAGGGAGEGAQQAGSMRALPSSTTVTGLIGRMTRASGKGPAALGLPSLAAQRRLGPPPSQEPPTSRVSQRLARVGELVDWLLLPDASARALSSANEGWDRLVIHPDNRLKFLFDIVIFASVLYTIYVAPLQLAFEIQISPGWEHFIDALFLFDVGLRFLHGYVQRGYPVTSLRTIATRYARSWFAVELLASLPYATLSGNPDLHVLAILRAVRLLRVKALMTKMATKVGASSTGPGAFLRVVNILLAWLIFAHCFACGFFALGWRTR